MTVRDCVVDQRVWSEIGPVIVIIRQRGGGVIFRRRQARSPRNTLWTDPVLIKFKNLELKSPVLKNEVNGFLGGKAGLGDRYGGVLGEIWRSSSSVFFFLSFTFFVLPSPDFLIYSWKECLSSE